MKVILLKDVKNVGKKYEETEVKKGYALNYLLPQELALTATNQTLKALADERARHTEKMREQEKELAEKLATLGDTAVTINAKANEQGHLFAGIGRDEVVAALNETHDLTLDSTHIDLEHAIKEVGDHEIPVTIADQKITLTVTVEAGE